MRTRQLAAYGAGVAILGVAILLVRRPLASGVGRAQTQVTEAARELTAEPESVMSRAVYQHFRARREAVATMRADLRKWAVAESAFIADSGRPVMTLEPPDYGFTASKGNAQTLRFGPWSWGPVVWMAGRREGITCWVYVTLDTRLSELNSGQPACAGNSALPPRIDSILRGETPPSPPRR